MRVVILKSFSTDGANGRTQYVPGQEVAMGQKSWIDKGLAMEVKPKPTPKPDAKSDD